MQKGRSKICRNLSKFCYNFLMKRQTDPILSEFSAFLLNIKGYSMRTVEAYLTDLTIFLEFLKRQGIDSPFSNKVTLNHLRRFLSQQSALKFSPKTLARRIASLKAFYRWAKKKGYISFNLASSLKAPKIPTNLPSFLTEAETEILFENFKPESPKDYRDLMLFKLMYGCGLRISEAINLKVSDYSEVDGQIRVLGKGSKERIIPLPYKLKHELDFYLKNVLPELAKRTPTVFMFPGKEGKPISDTLARKNLRKVLLKVGLANKISPHGLRHSLATHLLARGVDIRIVQEILGHSSLNTTQIYTHTNKTWLQSVYLKTHPRS